MYPSEFITDLVPILAVFGLLYEENKVVTELQQKRKQIDQGVASKILSTLITINSNITIWDSKKSFKVVAYNKRHQWSKKPEKSLLSPKNPASHLYPDGLISPKWISRYKDEFPSIIIAFHDLWESMDKDPLAESSVSELEKDYDGITASEINSQKIHAIQTGAKFVVVFLLKRSITEHPIIEERLGFFRKSCGLEKSNIFTLAVFQNGGSQKDLTKPLENLQKQLFELSNNYFKEHEKQIKKKKSKILAGSTKPLAATFPKVLGPRGWLLRYEFKLAVFSEFRLDQENSVQCYRNAYLMLVEMMQQTVSNCDSNEADFQMYSPRWQEACVLLDIINIKLMKLLLNTNQVVESFAQHQRHLSNCKDFPENAFQSLSLEAYNQPLLPGLSHLATVLGGGSFTYWEWISNQYKIYGDLIDLISSKRQKFPLPFPVPGSTGNTLLNTVTGIGNSNSGFGPYSSVNPLLTVQHPGFYYLVAARAGEERWKRYYHAANGSSGTEASESLPRLAFKTSLYNESQIDHGSIVIDLLTKAYENFKKLKGVRLPLFLASEIARVYQEIQQYEMALKFYDKISKSYRKESWFTLLAVICHRMKKCAFNTANLHVQLECLVELLHPTITPDPNTCATVMQEMITLLGGRPIGLPTPVIDMNTITSFFSCDFCFEHNQGQVLKNHAFQVTLDSLMSISSDVLRIKYVIIEFSNSDFNYYIINNNESFSELVMCTAEKRVIVNLSTEPIWAAYATLTFTKESHLILQGSIFATEHQHLEATSVSIILDTLTPLQLKVNFKERSEKNQRNRWYSQSTSQEHISWSYLPGKGDNWGLRIEQREPKFDLQLEFINPSFVHETTPLLIKATSFETEPVRLIIVIKCFIDYANSEGDKNSIFKFDSEDVNQNSTFIHVDFGLVVPSKLTTKTVFIRSEKAGPRVLLTSAYGVLNNVIRKINDFKFDLTDSTILFKDFNPIAIKFDNSFESFFDFEVTPSCALDPKDLMGPLIAFQPNRSNIQKQCSWNIHFSVKNVANIPLFLESVKLTCNQENSNQQISGRFIGSSLQPSVWKSNNIECFLLSVNVKVDDLTASTTVVFGKIEICWKRVGEDICSTSIIDIPNMDVKPELIRVIATIPPKISVGKSISIGYKIQNLTLHLAELVAFMESNDYFVFAGYKQVNIRVLPFSTQTLAFNVYPLVGGRWPLPSLRIMKRSDAIALNEATTGFSLTKVDVDKCFSVLAPSAYKFGSKNAELLVYVNPDSQFEE